MPLTNIQDARSLADMWAMFRAGAIPPQAPNYQVDSMRDAFYGGAWAFSLLLSHAFTRGDADDGVCDMLDKMQDEINAHTMATVRAVRISAEQAERVAIVKHGMPLTDAEEAYIRTLLARDDDEEPPNNVQ
ncbi:hypothetical protein CBM2626_A40035 [Cupriavidus taiwanensis]|uniref:hypothetical protein n=1 Tax=Cupriavidus taiwanensis TaxID=164546 RepID=UPI000E1733E0|nr:hypothetical protein [Cupriavidus taiwanensis]SOZ99490.1 hypothetical protein CBM2626_A40035 [Cupriavidus taiwanensis]